jgi:AraC-like DNA-binding protein
LAPHGAMLRQLIAHDSQARGVGRAIEHIRRELKQSLAMSDLAKLAGMSTSSFYKHFNSIAATSSLQYQKDLRLLEARRLLRTEGYTVSGAAYEVGYESPTQFSREYARKFGQPPRAEIATA